MEEAGDKKIEKNAKSELFTRFINKVVSRKLLVWGIASVAMFTKHIDVDTWTMISMAFIGSEAFVNTTLAWKGGKTK